VSDPTTLVSNRLAAAGKQELASALSGVETMLRRFVSFQNEHQSAAAALWVAHVYAIAAAPAAAYLRITSAVEESGKTTLLEVLEELLGERAINSISVSPASVFRTREKYGPVALLLDEIDNTLRDRKDDGARDLLALVNGGYRRSASVLRVVGANHESRRFAVFGPAAIAGLGSLHPTTESRCIPIVLERKARGSGERWLPFLLENESAGLRERLAMWASDEVIERLRLARPAIPEELRDRHAEAWWGLFAIADEAAGDWPARARLGATVLHASRDGAATMSLKVLLLAHIRQAFHESNTDRLSSAALVRLLVENEEGPWARFWGAELAREETPRAAQADLAAKLRDFKRPDGGPLKPHGIRLADGSTPRGYGLLDFDDAFARHLSPTNDVELFPPATPATPATVLASDVARVASVAGGRAVALTDGLAAAVQRAVELAGGNRFVAARSLAEDGVPAPDGNAWTAVKIERVERDAARGV
jgi:hypothetical protein